MQTATQSERLFVRMNEIIPGGVNSAARNFKSVNQMPLIVERGEGDTLIDVDGNRFIDFQMSWGPLVHGHAHPQIVKAVQHRVSLGTSFGLSCPVEEALASKIIECVPSIEQIRFVSSGTEATMSAARLARGFTGRKTIVKFKGCYHGHADFFLVQAGSGVFGLTATSSSAGIPDEIVQHTACLPYNDVEVTREFLRQNQVAAVILEPIAGNMGVVPASLEFIQMLRDETQRQGAVLIFDEVITGFRVALGGAQEYYGVTPDLTCFGKIIGGGLPAAAFGGRRDIMQQLAPCGKVYQAGTLSGNPVAMEAGLQNILMLQHPGVYQELVRKTDVITQPVREKIQARGMKACLQQVGSMFTLFFGVTQVRNMDDAYQLDGATFERFFKFLFERGVFLPPSQYEASFISTVHTEANLMRTRDLILEFLDAV